MITMLFDDVYDLFLFEEDNKAVLNPIIPLIGKSINVNLNDFFKEIH